MSTTATPAVTPSTDSAPVSPSVLPELSSLSQEQRAEWRRTGEMPSSPDSAPAKKDESAVADSAPQKDKKTAVTRSDPAPEKDTQQHAPKPKEYGEKRFQELANENKTLKERLEALERKSSQPEKREEKQVSQPAPKAEEYKPLDEKQWFKDNQGKTYEDFVRAAARHEAKWEADQQVKQAMQNLRQEMAQESAKKELQTKLNDATERYGKEEVGKIFPALESIVKDEQIPYAVKAMINDSDVVIDLLYTLRGDEAAFTDFLKLSKSNPAAAIRQIVTTESLVREQLKANSEKARGTDGKFQKTGKEPDAKAAETAAAKPETRAPRPPVEVGGHSSPPEDAAVAAVKADDFRAAKGAFLRDYAARHKL